jgi:integrase
MWKKLQANWSANLILHKAGELKDFWTFVELDEFLSLLTDTPKMSVEGWQAAYRSQINMGCREGNLGNMGIVGLLWEDINFVSKRCSIREKGHRGNALERWNNVPLDLFSFLHGWDWLLKFWIQQGKPTIGKVFPISYNNYLDMFNATRRKCKSRIRIDSATQRPHIFRRIHGQYAKRIGLPLELICGTAPNGRFGVGWKDPKIPVLYYLSEEAEDIDPVELAFMESHADYKQVLESMKEQNAKIKKIMGTLGVDSLGT